MSEKLGFSHTQEKSGQSYTFCWKKGLIMYLAALKKGAIRHAHTYSAIYRKLPRPLTPSTPDLPTLNLYPKRKMTSKATSLYRNSYCKLISIIQSRCNDDLVFCISFDIIVEVLLERRRCDIVRSALLSWHEFCRFLNKRTGKTPVEIISRSTISTKAMRSSNLANPGCVRYRLRCGAWPETSWSEIGSINHSETRTLYGSSFAMYIINSTKLLF